MRQILLAIFSCCVAYSQTGEDPPRFEVASVKAAPPRDLSKGIAMRFGGGGPGSKDPGRIDWVNVSLLNLVLLAYDVKRYQVAGPDWLSSALFDVTAKIPEGATKEQFKIMQQNLLADRFLLQLHHEQRDSLAYVLSVGKGGTKMKLSPDEPPPVAGAPPANPGDGGKMSTDDDGFPIIPGIRGAYTVSNHGRLRMRATQETMTQLVNMLSNNLGHPVTDNTALTGHYDFTLTYAMPGRLPAAPEGSAAPDGDADPDLIGALTQIGLKLEQKKAKVDTLVIDHVEKVPTDN